MVSGKCHLTGQSSLAAPLAHTSGGKSTRSLREVALGDRKYSVFQSPTEDAVSDHSMDDRGVLPGEVRKRMPAEGRGGTGRR